ncbi:MAG TPA: type IV pilin N-terminal domain-containing protein [Methanocorpusculum sp.]|nr:type IV pilin N-terminal domain-containing protein [Methanocorpusculum sp.]HJK00370.1 type IV pilin N-terminal domain-containing protein [Methanocorpusculum sp.]HJK03065.1 type IV pilin N-terminal domain-containing protein [Methanocorpusculum sp.]HJK03776.1 type IV pilin N-terminal domain-containing protein [Methanocorpusculum sp.]HJK05501.1 type IV pilin N-terminal domain-containing protein [Methanocorpusculum sp.]
MHNDDAVTPVVTSVLLLLMVIGCCATIGVIVFHQMNTEETTVPNVRIQTSAESTHYLYHAGGESLFRNDISIYNLDNDITHRTLVEGDKDWTVWKSGEYLYSEQTLSDVYILWRNGEKEYIIYQYGVNRKTGVTPITDVIPD